MGFLFLYANFWLLLSAATKKERKSSAGKGHEDYQILPVAAPSGGAVFGNDGRPLTHKIPFSDSGVVRKLAHSLQLVGKEEAILTAA